MSAYEINQKVAEEICNTFRWNGLEFQLGECVALVDGEVIAVAKDLDGAVRAVQALRIDPKRSMIVEVGPPAVDYIWGPYFTRLDAELSDKARLEAERAKCGPRFFSETDAT